MTTVSNVKVKYIRPKYKDLEQWLKDNNNVYIGRSGVIFINNKIFPDSASPFVIPSCNPFKEGKDGSRDEII
jgi:hypothetical protein